VNYLGLARLVDQRLKSRTGTPARGAGRTRDNPSPVVSAKKQELRAGDRRRQAQADAEEAALVLAAEQRRQVEVEHELAVRRLDTALRQMTEKDPYRRGAAKVAMPRRAGKTSGTPGQRLMAAVGRLGFRADGSDDSDHEEDGADPESGREPRPRSPSKHGSPVDDLADRLREIAREREENDDAEASSFRGRYSHLS